MRRCVKGFRRGLLTAACAGLFAAGAQAQTAGDARKPADAKPVLFDVASIKVNNSMSSRISINVSNNSFQATNVTLKMLIEEAYDLKNDQLVGLPKWAADTHFDINAKVVDPDVQAMKKQTPEQRGEMVQQLLAERFGLKVHRETRVLPVYDLVIAKGGTKLKDVSKDDPNRKVSGMGPGMMRMGPSSLNGVGVEMASLVNALSRRLERMVIDKTGLTGKYDFSLTWQGEAGPEASTEATAASIFTAVEEQLGLKLEGAKAPVDVLVVDHLEMPSEN